MVSFALENALLCGAPVVVPLTARPAWRIRRQGRGAQMSPGRPSSGRVVGIDRFLHVRKQEEVWSNQPWTQALRGLHCGRDTPW